LIASQTVRERKPLLTQISTTMILAEPSALRTRTRSMPFLRTVTIPMTDLPSRLIQETHHGETIDYAYDLIGQLVSVERTIFGNEFCTYDANGNRTSSHLYGSDYVTGLNNQLLTDGEFL
jgi:hypothetical protein